MVIPANTPADYQGGWWHLSFPAEIPPRAESHQILLGLGQTVLSWVVNRKFCKTNLGSKSAGHRPYFNYKEILLIGLQIHQCILTGCHRTCCWVCCQKFLLPLLNTTEGPWCCRGWKESKGCEVGGKSEAVRMLSSCSSILHSITSVLQGWWEDCRVSRVYNWTFCPLIWLFSLGLGLVFFFPPKWQIYPKIGYNSLPNFHIYGPTYKIVAWHEVLSKTIGWWKSGFHQKHAKSS